MEPLFINEDELLQILNHEGGWTATKVMVKTPTCGKCKAILAQLENEAAVPGLKVFEFNPATCRKITSHEVFKQLSTVPALLLISEDKVEIYPKTIETWEDFKEAVNQ